MCTWEYDKCICEAQNELWLPLTQCSKQCPQLSRYRLLALFSLTSLSVDFYPTDDRHRNKREQTGVGHGHPHRSVSMLRLKRGQQVQAGFPGAEETDTRRAEPLPAGTDCFCVYCQAVLLKCQISGWTQESRREKLVHVSVPLCLCFRTAGTVEGWRRSCLTWTRIGMAVWALRSLLPWLLSWPWPAPPTLKATLLLFSTVVKWKTGVFRDCECQPVTVSELELHSDICDFNSNYCHIGSRTMRKAGVLVSWFDLFLSDSIKTSINYSEY